ncbi:zinc finger-like domain-containing protein [Moorena sp. SIO3A2]|uniref:Uncharacterized protein n=4 Tax=Coleofasciculaceae TaxID=1892251 RepID=F4XVH9_9CYAN|nr:zinc finger-like domain-containing protein [Moorena sp. SIO3A2]EGJ31242.1 hypothetical protein LYNGBM3L_41320 [Moorena producens 3L]NEP31961.1 hypothetical protein [Moorena sp. SIO3B2]NER86610.1 hypothetical protein [Moorena sp. SIO3A2]OLT66335.1 hypothetical protein BI334_16095 [Moorena producens 3L]
MNWEANSMLEATLWILTTLFIGTLISSLFHRFRFGATVEQLIETRFYEVLPVRSLFWALFCAFGYGLAFTSFAALTNIFQLVFNESRSSETACKLLLSGGLAFLFAITLKSLKYALLRIPNQKPLPVKTDGVSVRYGIHPRLLKTLGFERFPNEKSPKNVEERIVRYLIAVIGVTCIGLIFFILFKNNEYNFEIDFTTSIQDVLSQIPSIQTSFILTTIAIIPTLIVLIIFNNRDYTFLNLNQSLLVKVGIVFLSIFCLRYLNLKFYTTVVIVAIILSLYGLRMIADLILESSYTRVKRVYNPIAEKIKHYTSYLEQIYIDPQLKLGSLQKNQLADRISRGCKNLEERGIFVVRNLARFLNLVEVQYEEFAVAMLRYLTVRRYITLGGASGTYRPLQRPAVPMWDYDLFPLHPPNGYVNWIDPLWLPSQWDVVETCWRCGGTGQVMTTVTETDSEGNTKTRREYETCGTCSGSGRLKHTQILNTQWQRMMPLVTYPSIPIPELVEDAEEKVFYRQPITENFVAATEQARAANANNLILQKMYQTGSELKQLHKLHKSEVENLHNGYLYRADFQIASFRMIMIEFVNLGRRFGWFFGRRPEFYFPQLPLSYSAVFTLMLLPPLGLALSIFLFRFSTKIFPLLISCIKVALS